eukprot:Anaeramoba_flamelloidesc27200_g1_i1.p1 GENE.c27200_g1_i1~~c27200_g1_i1.p1  ORF type:complete len:150 (-),score=22.40 c27200_g1_i1:8-457(-)
MNMEKNKEKTNIRSNKKKQSDKKSNKTKKNIVRIKTEIILDTDTLCQKCNLEKYYYYCSWCQLYYCKSCKNQVHTEFLKEKHKNFILRADDFTKEGSEEGNCFIYWSIFFQLLLLFSPTAVPTILENFIRHTIWLSIIKISFFKSKNQF